MRLADLLGPRRVLIPLAASTWDDGIRALLDACLADGCVRDPAKLELAVRKARPEDTLSFGPHAVLPHFRTDAVDRVVAALGVASQALKGRGADGGAEGETQASPGARIVLLVLAPPREAVAYLRAVAAFARALARTDVVGGLHAARDPEEALALEALRDFRLEDDLLVGDVMAPAVLVLTPDMALDDAARLLGRRGLDAAPVVGPAGEVVGLLSSRELVRHFLPAYVQRLQTGEHRAAPRPRPGSGAAGPERVADAMARNVLCVSEAQSLSDVASLLANKDVPCLPVVGDGVLKGVLTRGDIVRKLVGQ